jgi:hypothetical protein
MQDGVAGIDPSQNDATAKPAFSAEAPFGDQLSGHSAIRTTRSGGFPFETKKARRREPAGFDRFWLS